MGSEMCIRDSGYIGARLDFKVSCQLDSVPCHRGIGKERGLRRIACLLYTSDAADDLRCVDLGGRRIINKKTNILRVTKTLYSLVIHFQRPLTDP